MRQAAAEKRLRDAALQHASDAKLLEKAPEDGLIPGGAELLPQEGVCAERAPLLVVPGGRWLAALVRFVAIPSESWQFSEVCGGKVMGGADLQHPHGIPVADVPNTRVEPKPCQTQTPTAAKGNQGQAKGASVSKGQTREVA